MKDFKISIYLGTFQRRYGVRKALEIAKNVVGGKMTNNSFVAI